MDKQNHQNLPTNQYSQINTPTTPSTVSSTPVISTNSNQFSMLQHLQQNTKSVEHVSKEFEEYQKQINDLNTQNIKQKALKADQQLERLTTEKFQNPYDVLLLSGEATEEEIKKQYKNFSLILHPDRCKDERAKDAFFVVDQAFKTLMDQEKRKVYLRIMREAKERTDFERSKENKRRQKLFLPQLPEDTFEADYKETLKKIFDEIEEKKMHMARLEQSQQKQKMDELEAKKLMEQYRILTEDEWEKTRDERVGNWRNFSKKKTVIGTKKSDKGIRAPQLKQEERPASAPKIDPSSGKPMGLNEDYKKKWK